AGFGAGAGGRADVPVSWAALGFHGACDPPDMTMLQLAGPAAETAFRLGKLRRELRAVAPTVDDVAARFVHYVHLERSPTERERRVLDALLTYGTAAPPPAPGAQALHVVP